MTRTSLVTGAHALVREAAIRADIDPAISTAVILEGLPNGHSPFDTDQRHPLLNVIRIAPGCMCCVGNMILRVTLNRILRTRPARLYISVANSDHLHQLHAFFSAPPYDLLLDLTPDVVTDAPSE